MPDDGADTNGRAYVHAPTIDDKLFIINEGILTITDQLEALHDMLRFHMGDEQIYHYTELQKDIDHA